MGSELTDAFKGLWEHKRPENGLLVPLMNWVSGDRNSIEAMNRINLRFNINTKVLISELTLNSSVRCFIPYPKGFKQDEKLQFFYNDVCKYYGWTSNELSKNMKVIDLEALKPIIASEFAYSNEERKLLQLPKLNGLAKRSKK